MPYKLVSLLLMYNVQRFANTESRTLSEMAGIDFSIRILSDNTGRLPF